MCESFFIVPINDSHELPESEAAGATEHVNFTKTKKSKEVVESEDGFDEYNPTIEDVIKFCCEVLVDFLKRNYLIFVRN